MISELTVAGLRVGYLILLWFFVFAAINILRRDVFGTVVTPRGRNRRRNADTPPPAAAPAPQVPAAPASNGVVGGEIYLRITAGPLTGATLPLGVVPITIGRAPSSTLVLDDDYASGQHARLVPAQGQWWIEDLGSTNGTFVDDERISQPRQLHLGLRIRIGRTTMELAR